MNRALDVGRTLIDRGYAPLVPHYTYLLDRDGAIPHDVWMDVDLPWVESADVVLRLPGESRGAEIEVAHARERGIPVVESLDDLPPSGVSVAREAGHCSTSEKQCGGGPGWKTTRQVAEPQATECRISPSAPGGNAVFLAILDEMRALHLKKAADYGSDADPLANVRSAVDVGLRPEVGAWIRARDKVHRIDSFFRRGSLENESVEDSLLDLAAYSLIALVMMRGG